MNSELISVDTQQLSQIQEILGGKNWYTTAADEGFDWKLSTQKVAEMMQDSFGWGTVGDIRDAIESSFSPESLTVIKTDPPKKFIAALDELEDIEVFVWTLGDCDWQRIKFEKSGVNEIIDDNHYSCNKNSKQQELLAILKNIGASSASGKPKYVYVVDDKFENLAQAKKLQKDVENLNITLYDYHLKLKDPSADPTACFNYLKLRIDEHRQKNEQVIIILDFDGVVIDTDRTILELASRNILSKMVTS